MRRGNAYVILRFPVRPSPTEAPVGLSRSESHMARRMSLKHPAGGCAWAFLHRKSFDVLEDMIKFH